MCRTKTAEREAPCGVRVGDVFVSVGCAPTRARYVEVVDLVGERTVVVRGIRRRRGWTNGGTLYAALPMRGDYVGATRVRRRVHGSVDGEVSPTISISGSTFVLRNND